MGFPSPAQDYAEKNLSLDEICIVRRSATYFMRADSSIPHLGILKGALLVIDSSLKPSDGSLVIASTDGSCRLHRLRLHPFPALLNAEDSCMIRRLDSDDFTDEAAEIFGVVTWVANKTTGT